MTLIDFTKFSGLQLARSVGLMCRFTCRFCK